MKQPLRAIALGGILALLGAASSARGESPARAATSARGESPTCAASPTLTAIAARRTLRVGVFPGLVPFVAVGPDAEDLGRLLGAAAPPSHAAKDGRAVLGFDIDLAAAAAGALGASLEITIVDRFEQLLPGLRAGAYDVALSGISRTLERATTVAFTQPYFTSGLQVLVRDAKRFTSLEALDRGDVRIAVRAGTTSEQLARTRLPRAIRVPAASDAALYRALDDERAVDAAVIDYLSARDAAVRGRVHATLVPVEERRFSTEHFALAIRQGDPDWLGWLNLFLDEEKGSGALQRIATRYNLWFRTER